MAEQIILPSFFVKPAVTEPFSAAFGVSIQKEEKSPSGSSKKERKKIPACMHLESRIFFFWGFLFGCIRVYFQDGSKKKEKAEFNVA